MAEIAAKKLYVGDELVYEKQSLDIKFLGSAILTGRATKTVKNQDWINKTIDKDVILLVTAEGFEFGVQKKISKADWKSGLMISGSLTTGEIYYKENYKYGDFYIAYNSTDDTFQLSVGGNAAFTYNVTILAYSL